MLASEKKSVKLFVTGTDTGVGKTLVSVLLLAALNDKGFRTAALKPIAAGGEYIDGQLKNEDALLLSQNTSERHAYTEINPIVFEEAIAPHIAAQRCNQEINIDECLKHCEPALHSDVDYVVIEGAGGWLVPVNEHKTFADLALAMSADVILVVGLQLGCINHALLSAQAITHSGCRLVGWVANHLDPLMEASSENIASIQKRLNAPLLGEIPFVSHPSPAKLKRYLLLDELLSI